MVYAGECAGNHSEGSGTGSETCSGNDCLKKRGLNVGQARRRADGRNEWRLFVKWDAKGIARVMKP